MPIFDVLPGESNSSIISSMINLVCPRCGGSLMEFECNGRRQRNWLPEWEWANLATAILAPGTRMTKRSADRKPLAIAVRMTCHGRRLLFSDFSTKAI